MGVFPRLIYLVMAMLWAQWVTSFFTGRPIAPHLQMQAYTYMAIAHVATVLLVLAGLTSRVTRRGFVLRWMALLGVGGTFGLLLVALLLGAGFYVMGGKLEARVTNPVQWGTLTLGIALATLLFDVAMRTRDLAAK
jgi:hypothetical protein